MYVKGIGVLVLAASLSGCAGYKVDSVISRYTDVADQVELGDSKEEVLAILGPTQEGLPEKERKNPDKYYENDIKMEIYYMRVARKNDANTTDDEFVPYIFKNGKLIGIGWEVLGGPKTRGKSRQWSISIGSGSRR